MSKGYKKARSFRKSQKREKDDKVNQTSKKEKKKRTKNLKRRLRLIERHRRFRQRERKKNWIQEKKIQIKLACGENRFFEDFRIRVDKEYFAKLKIHPDIEEVEIVDGPIKIK